jgi:hypothetical protein
MKNLDRMLDGDEEYDDEYRPDSGYLPDARRGDAGDAGYGSSGYPGDYGAPTGEMPRRGQPGAWS